MKAPGVEHESGLALMMNYTQILLIGVFSVVCTATKWPFLPRPALFIGHDVAKGVKGHIWESRGDLFWVRHIPRCYDVTRSLCPSWKCGRKCVSVSCDHLLEMGLKILIRVLSIFSGGPSRSCDVTTSWYAPHSKHISIAFLVWVHHDAVDIKVWTLYSIQNVH